MFLQEGSFKYLLLNPFLGTFQSKNLKENRLLSPDNLKNVVEVMAMKSENLNDLIKAPETNFFIAFNLQEYCKSVNLKDKETSAKIYESFFKLP